MKTTVTVALILLLFLVIVEVHDMKMKIFLCLTVGLLFRYIYLLSRSVYQLMEMNQLKDDVIKKCEETNQLKDDLIKQYEETNQLKDDLIKKYEEANQYKENIESHRKLCEITKSSDERIEKVSTFLSNNRTLKEIIEINEPRLRHEQNFAQGI